ncbi:LysE family translocator [Plantactinospora soyae]|uniref:Threonine/homoserine/homoserine lactone efflux protein n=1 Tax=Plantactinospora soyae TaxID=1544732 RepID=A0A927MK87_9ACTN|nr:LysE family translocator [Plantactinospora soyae]MBE1492700.1 threonine/homoserine/homoserine lactone efflux protein [Plantactinospora soyae]
MHGVSVLGFLVAVAPITATPGASLTLVVSRVAAGGRRQGWWVILGTVTGIYLHATLAAVGLAALVLRSAQAFWVVKVIGAGYLVGLGLWLLWSATRHRQPHSPAPATIPEPTIPEPTIPEPTTSGLTTAGPTAAEPTISEPTISEPAAASGPAVPRSRRLPWRGHHPYLQGLLGNVLNPKAAAVYLTLAPQFLDPHRSVLVPMLVLATAHAALHTCWLAGWTAISGAAARLLSTARVRRALDRLTGAILIGLGIRTVTD